MTGLWSKSRPTRSRHRKSLIPGLSAAAFGRQAGETGGRDRAALPSGGRGWYALRNALCREAIPTSAAQEH